MRPMGSWGALGWSLATRSGIAKENVDPCCGVLTTFSSPPIRATRCWLRARLRPVPVLCGSALSSIVAEASNSCARCSGAIPMPESRTVNEKVFWAVAAAAATALRTRWASSTTSPRSVNFTALLSRLVSTCSSRCRSPITIGWASIAALQINSMPRSLASVAKGAIASANRSGRWNSTGVSSMFPASIRERSSTSFNMPSSVVPESRMVPQKCAWRSVSSVLRNSSAMPITPLSGVRMRCHTEGSSASLWFALARVAAPEAAFCLRFGNNDRGIALLSSVREKASIDETSLVGESHSVRRAAAVRETANKAAMMATLAIAAKDSLCVSRAIAQSGASRQQLIAPTNSVRMRACVRGFADVITAPRRAFARRACSARAASSLPWFSSRVTAV